MPSRHHNPEKREWRGRSYRKNKPVVELRAEAHARCSYYDRQEFRHADEGMFGCSPFDFMTREQAEQYMNAQEAEDQNDPPCGECECCLAGEDVPE